MNKEIINHINKGQVVAIIPARSGSKGVKDKNIRLLNGHPMIAYTIAAAKLSKSVDRIIVSTDSEKYAEIARKYGAEVPFLRPAEISGDKATDIEFMIHAINWLYENEGSVPEYWVHLRATCPLRIPDDIDKAVALTKQTPEATCTLAVCCPTNILTPYKWLKIEGEYLRSIMFDTVDEANQPRQNYPDAYMRTITADVLLSETIINGTMYGNHVVPFMTEYTADVDDLQTFEECQKAVLNAPYINLSNYLDDMIK